MKKIPLRGQAGVWTNDTVQFAFRSGPTVSLLPCFFSWDVTGRRAFRAWSPCTSWGSGELYQCSVVEYKISLGVPRGRSPLATFWDMGRTFYVKMLCCFQGMFPCVFPHSASLPVSLVLLAHLGWCLPACPTLELAVSSRRGSFSQCSSRSSGTNFCVSGRLS